MRYDEEVQKGFKMKFYKLFSTETRKPFSNPCISDTKNKTLHAETPQMINKTTYFVLNFNENETLGSEKLTSKPHTRYAVRKKQQR